MAPVDEEEAISILREKLQSKSFRKAVGARVAKAIEVLIRRYECGACLTESEAAALANDYYVFESRLRRLLELYDKLTRGALRTVVAEILGEEFHAAPVEYGALLKELEAYRRALFAVVGRVLKCYSSTSSSA